MAESTTKTIIVELPGGETMSRASGEARTMPARLSRVRIKKAGVEASDAEAWGGPINRAIVDHFRCPESFADYKLTNRLSPDQGYFRFGQNTICYGRSASGFRTSFAESVLYDALDDVTTEGSTACLPFSPSDVIDNLRLERYASHYCYGASNRWKRALRNVYYFLRPLMHVNFRRHIQRAHSSGWRNRSFPRWPVDTTVEDLCEQLLLLSMKAQGVDKVPFVWFWPNGAQSCVAMTHDVETESGRAFCTELMDIDDSFGIKASIQLVPEGSYIVDPLFIQGIRDRGFEVNIQDLNHDGHLFRNREEFLRRAEKINEYGKAYQTRGFRAAVLYRNLNWYDSLDFSFDMSVPNVAHLDPQRGGCCTVMPYFIGDILEIPLTTTQDYMLFHLLNDYSLDLWKAQIELIIQKNGLVSFIVHPDYVSDAKAQGVYRNLLGFLHQLGLEKRIWFAVAGEIDHWWRLRSNMRVVDHSGKWRIEGSGAERAQLAFARVTGDRLEYELEA
jgi:hypothetical protein